MRAPKFWNEPPNRAGALATLLTPAAALWALGAFLRGAVATPRKADVPVLCVGNLTAGGTGKSPMVAALMQRCSALGLNAHIVSRGHGGTITGPHRVDAANDTHRDVGDEPLMLSSFGPVWVARDRFSGANAAAAAGARLVILDDGFQYPGLVKDASIVMVDAGVAFGNGRVIPAGPLREPVTEGLGRATQTVLVGSPGQRTASCERWPVLNSALPARLVPQQMGMPIAQAPVIAFAGIGRPEKFFETLEDMGARLIDTHAFADHYDYPSAILKRLQAQAEGQGALLLTTEKDAVRLPPWMRRNVLTVQVTLVLDEWGPIDTILQGLTVKLL